MNKHFTDEARQRMSESAKRRWTCQEERQRNSDARRTILDDDRLVALYASGLNQDEVAKEIGVSQKVVWRALRRLGVAPHKQAKRSQSGAANSAWVGDAAGYSACHLRVAVARGKPSLCSVCDCTTGRFEWANLTGRYEDINDYARMCVSCHRRFDNNRRIGPVAPIDCAHCGVPIVRRARNGASESPAAYRRRRFCSHACSNKARSPTAKEIT